MNLYEVMFILDPDLGEEEREKVLGRLKSTVAKNKGDIIRIEDQGIKSLAYKINKKPRGQYFLMYLEGPSEMSAEVERFLRIDESVMRFLPIRLEDDISREDLEKKAEMVEEAKPESKTLEQPEASEAGE